MLRMSLDVIPYGGLSMHFLRDSFFLEDYITEGCYAEERFPNCRSLIVLAFMVFIVGSADTIMQIDDKSLFFVFFPFV